MPQIDCYGSAIQVECSLAMENQIQNEGYGIMALWQTKSTNLFFSVPSC
ncbi:MAG: hypothetical protein EZS28_047292, partial [Streblomastix strix]